MNATQTVRENQVRALGGADLSFELWVLTALTIGCMILVLLTVILLFRRNRLGEERRQQRIITQWRPLLEHCLQRSPRTLPSLTRRDHVVFLYLWNQFYESVRTRPATPLIHVARRVGSSRLATALLGSRLLSQQILGVVTLGRLQSRAAWAPLKTLLTHQNSFLAFHAAQALLRIDPTAALPLLIPVLGQRTDWSPLNVVTMLNTVERGVAAETLVRAAIHGSPTISPRLLRYLPATHSPQGLPLLRQFISDRPPPPNMLATCLFVFGEFRDPEDLPVVRHYLAHEAWYVRVQAATALGKLGTADDEDRLIALFHDDQWWVRYRAGEALVSLESMTEEKLMSLQESLTSPEAHEILAPILAKFRARRSPIAVRP